MHSSTVPYSVIGLKIGGSKAIFVGFVICWVCKDCKDGVMVTFCGALAVLVRIFIAIAFYKNQFNFITLSYVNSIYLLNIVHLQ